MGINLLIFLITLLANFKLFKLYAYEKVNHEGFIGCCSWFEHGIM